MAQPSAEKNPQALDPTPDGDGRCSHECFHDRCTNMACTEHPNQALCQHCWACTADEDPDPDDFGCPACSEWGVPGARFGMPRRRSLDFAQCDGGQHDHEEALAVQGFNTDGSMIVHECIEPEDSMDGMYCESCHTDADYLCNRCTSYYWCCECGQFMTYGAFRQLSEDDQASFECPVGSGCQVYTDSDLECL